MTLLLGRLLLVVWVENSLESLSVLYVQISRCVEHIWINVSPHVVLNLVDHLLSARSWDLSHKPHELLNFIDLSVSALGLIDKVLVNLLGVCYILQSDC